MRRLVFFATLVLLTAPSAAARLGDPPPAPLPRDAERSTSWAQREIRLVVERGLMGGRLETFRADEPLTSGELEALVAGLSNTVARAPKDPRAPVTLAQLDARLVRALGLSDSAARFQQTARAAGLAPPSRFGSEVVARLLALRKNHPAARDELELLPNEPATRAEAAYSAAQILRFRGLEVARVKEDAEAFALPLLTEWQRRVLSTAVRLIGFPYVWAGSSERREPLADAPAAAGFDCSGFIWRVYKLEPYAGADALADTLRGRTTFAMSGEVSRTHRVPFERLAPADIVFFGPQGPKSKPKQVDHAAVYLGGGWLIHSSRYGVALTKLADWYRERFAWGRRALAEAGLTIG